MTFSTPINTIKNMIILPTTSQDGQAVSSAKSSAQPMTSPPLKEPKAPSEPAAAPSNAPTNNLKIFPTEPSLLKERLLPPSCQPSPWSSFSSSLPPSTVIAATQASGAAGSNSSTRASSILPSTVVATPKPAGPNSFSSILPSTSITKPAAIKAAATNSPSFKFKDVLKLERAEAIKNQQLAGGRRKKLTKSFGQDQFLEKRILITKRLAEQQNVKLDDNQENLDRVQSNGSLLELDQEVVKVQDIAFKDREGDVRCGNQEKSFSKGFGVGDGYQEEDVILSNRMPDKDTSSCKSLRQNGKVKAAASRASKKKQNAATNKQLAPAKIFLRRSKDKQVIEKSISEVIIKLCEPNC